MKTKVILIKVKAQCFSPFLAHSICTCHLCHLSFHPCRLTVHRVSSSPSSATVGRRFTTPSASFSQGGHFPSPDLRQSKLRIPAVLLGCPWNPLLYSSLRIPVGSLHHPSSIPAPLLVPSSPQSSLTTGPHPVQAAGQTGRALQVSRPLSLAGAPPPKQLPVCWLSKSWPLLLASTNTGAWVTFSSRLLGCGSSPRLLPGSKELSQGRSARSRAFKAWGHSRLPSKGCQSQSLEPVWGQRNKKN